VAAVRVRRRVSSFGICGGQKLLSRFHPSTSVSFATQSTDWSTLIIIHDPGLVHRPKIGRLRLTSADPQKRKPLGFRVSNITILRLRRLGLLVNLIKQTNSVALSPQPNYTDWSTATCRRNLVPTVVDRGVSRGQRGGSPYGRYSQFSRPERLIFFKVVPHLSSQGLSEPRFRPNATQNIW
jgi:hypothetical protein